MKRIAKRIVSLVLAMAFCLVTGNFALAAEELQTAALRTKTTAELMDCIPQARTQAEADAVFAELMARRAAGEPLRGMIDNYVTANSTTMTSSTVTVNYTVKAILPSGASLRVGYEYPASVRVPGTFAAVQSATGTYTKSFPGPFLSCQMRAVFKFSANSYSENKVLKTFMNVRGGSAGRVVTAGDAAIGYIVLTITSIVVTLKFPGTLSTLYMGATVPAGLNLTSLSEGQYIRVATSVSGNKLTTTVRVYASYETYTAGGAALRTHTGIGTIPTF